jgi:uncharacterized protein YcaQ
MGRRSTADLSAAEARRIALASQGLAAGWPAGRADSRRIAATARRLGAIQIDSVNVLVRAHYLPLFSRFGPYDTKSLDQLGSRPMALFEYLGHAASFLPIEMHPLIRWRMARFAGEPWEKLRSRVERTRPGYIDAVEKEIAERGPLAAGDLTESGRREKAPTKYSAATTAWWNWSDGKDVLEGLFRSGRVAVAGRRGFERLYDLPERVLPSRVLALSTPSTPDAMQGLVRIASRALGVATLRDLSDYFRLPVSETRASVRALVEEGALHPVRVEGWPDPAYLDSNAHAARSEARTLVSPFDSLMWDRARTERIFGFRYRIEIYVPQRKRQYGYYVLPFLLGDRLAARVDLKADRARRVLMVQAAHLEPENESTQVASELAGHLRSMASWLELDGVEVGVRGDLSDPLSKLFRPRPRRLRGG